MFNLTSFLKNHKKQLGVATVTLGCVVGIVIAAAPPANSVIGNQATATYVDATGTTRTSTSNLVQTTVAQVNAFTLTASATKYVAPGGTVYFPHTVTNTGNGPDTYTFSVAEITVTAPFSALCTGGTVASPAPAGCNVFIYPDADGNGVADSNVFITGATPQIAAGGTYNFILAMVWPAAVTTGTETLNLTATSVGGINGSTPAVAQINSDKIIPTLGPVINITKALKVTSGARSTAACVSPYTPSAECINTTVILNYTNTGGAATALTITDVIGVDATSGMRYVPGSGRWTGCTGTQLTDGSGSEVVACGGMAYELVGNIVTAVIPRVAAGESGTLSFDVNISNTAAVGAASTTNIAGFSYPNGASITTGITNTAAYTIAASASVVLNNKTTASTNAPGVADNSVIIASAAQGATLWFANVVWNTGSVTDTFDMSKVSQTFPVGTAIAFYSDTNTTCPVATTPVSGTTTPATLGGLLTDSNGNGVVDTGPVAPGVCKVVWTRVDLLPNSTVDVPGFNLQKRAKSVNDPTQFDDVTDALTDIVERFVDLTNGAQVGTTTVPQNGAGGGFNGSTLPLAIVTTNTGVQPGSTTRFNLTVKNITGAADNYNLSAWNTYSVVGLAGFTSAFGSGTTAGYSVAFFAGTCPASGVATGTAITNTGNIASAVPNNSVNVCAQITVPANASAGTKDVYFRVESPATASYAAPYAAWDVKRDAFEVAATSVVTITPDRSGSAVPGGNVLYPHQVCNTGNVATQVGLTASNNNTGNFNTALWLDVNTDGAISAGDVAIPTSGGSVLVPAGSCVAILDNTFVGAAATLGSTNTTTIVATVGGTTTVPPITGTVGSAMTGGTIAGTVYDTTTVVSGDVSLLKEQRQVNCVGGGVGTPIGASGNGVWTSGNLPVKIFPGNCIQYRVTATNTGATPATGLVISDSTPAYTKHLTQACAVSSALLSPGVPAVITSVTAPASGSTGALSTGAVTVPPASAAQLIFCVQVDS